MSATCQPLGSLAWTTYGTGAATVPPGWPKLRYHAIASRLKSPDVQV